MLSKISLAALLAGMAVTAGAQTVTVNAAGGADFTTITAAIASVKANVSTPDVVNIIGVGPYNESFVLDSSISVVGFGVRPTIITPGVTGETLASLNGRGISITSRVATPGAITVHLENMNIIPANAAVTRGIYTNNNNAGAGLSADTMTVELVDVLVTGNTGAGVPVSTTGLNSYDYTTNAGSFTFTDDLVFFQGIVDATLTRVIATNGKGAVSPDGMAFFPDVPGHTININGGCRFTYMNRLGIQFAADGSIVRMNGTAAEPILVIGNNLANVINPGIGIWHDNEALPASDYIMSYVYVLNNVNGGIGTGFANALQGLPQVTADHLVIANNGNEGIAIADDALQPWLITDSTIVNNSIKLGATTPQITIDSAAANVINTSITFKDTIIAGNGSPTSTAGENSVLIGDGTGLVTFDHVDLVTAGPNSLSAPFVLADTGVAPTQTAVVNVDPLLIQFSDHTLPTFVDVQEPTLATAASAGGPLKGAGDFVPISASQSFNLYN